MPRGDCARSSGLPHRSLGWSWPFAVRVSGGSILRDALQQRCGVNIQRPAKIENHVERGIVAPRLQSPQIGDRDIGPKRDLLLSQVAVGAQAS